MFIREKEVIKHGICSWRPNQRRTRNTRKYDKTEALGEVEKSSCGCEDKEDQNVGLKFREVQ